jgi:hypothetical protein
MKKGFITDDGYAAVPYGKKNLIIIYGGHQLEMVSTVRQAHKYIKDHRTQSQPGTVFL